jgi:hypothetical protein
MTATADLSTIGVTDLLSAHRPILDKLRKREIIRSKNNPTSDYAAGRVRGRIKAFGTTPDDR